MNYAAVTVAVAVANVEEAEEQTHPVPAMLVTGGALQVESAVQLDAVEVGTSVFLRLSAFTRTGIAWPVDRLNVL